MEEVIVISLMVLSLLTIFCLYIIFNKRGLYFSNVILNLLTFVLTFKITTVMKMNINVGIIPLISSLSIIYIYMKNYGDKNIKDLIKISLYSNITLALILTITNYFVPAITETISINMQGTFEYNYKILILYPIISLISQIAIIKLYKLVSNIQNNLYVSIILNYIITSLVYTVLFYVLAYINIIEIKYSLFLGVSTYILGLFITIINAIFINCLTKKKVAK